MLETGRSTGILDNSKTIALHHAGKFPARQVLVFKNFFKLEDNFPAIAIVVEEVKYRITRASKSAESCFSCIIPMAFITSGKESYPSISNRSTLSGTLL